MLRALAAVLMLLPAMVATMPAAALAQATVALATTTAQHVSGVEIAALTDKLAGLVINDPDRSVVPAFHLADQVVPAGKVELTTLSPLVYATYISIPVQIAVDGRIAKTVMAGYRVQQYIHTAVAAHDLTPGAILSADDLTLSRVLSNGRPSVDLGALVGRKIRAATPRGAVIFVEQTSINELVKAGAGAILVVHDGPVSLTADVVARTGGGLGESVTVYNAQTNKILSGVVTGPDRVELVLPEGDSE
jgi:flagella basal body P-ring formation protein FlgA